MKAFLLAVVAFVSIIVIFAVFGFFLLIDPSPMTHTEYLVRESRLTWFSYTGAGQLSDRETKTLYKKTCTKKCHSRDVIERTVHNSREWAQTVKRMREKNGASVTHYQAEAIVNYLSGKYGSNIPTIISPEGSKYLKKYLWRSDFGESDLYVDIIYTPPAYFNVVGADEVVEGYSADKYTIFTVYLNTHQEKLDYYPMEKIISLTRDNGHKLKPLLWKTLYESGDLHHREGLLVFEKEDAGSSLMEMTLDGLPGPVRILAWSLPVPELRLAQEGL